MEGDQPFEVKVEINKTLQNFDIKSIGYDDFEGQLTHHVSAHPKVDRKTGHYMAFGYDRYTPIVHYSLFDKERKLLNSMQIPITSCRLIHDFAATEHYIIIPDLPMESDPLNCVIYGKHLF
jgi:carotenoid cleavage dioxygenase-like enzyme